MTDDPIQENDIVTWYDDRLWFVMWIEGDQATLQKVSTGKIATEVWVGSLKLHKRAEAAQ